jgi:hypothetical protein
LRSSNGGSRTRRSRTGGGFELIVRQSRWQRPSCSSAVNKGDCNLRIRCTGRKTRLTTGFWTEILATASIFRGRLKRVNEHRSLESR